MKISFTFFKKKFLIALALLNLTSQATQIYLDTTFGTQGIVSQLFNTSSYATGIKVLSSGKINFNGNTNIEGANNAIVGRYNANGTLDTTYGTAGTTTFLLGTDTTSAACQLQSDEKLVIVGQAILSGVVTPYIARFDTAGILDTSYNSTGSNTILISGSDGGGANALVIQPADQYAVVAGTTVISGIGQIFVARFTNAGVLDATFGTAGITLLPIGSSCAGLAVTLQADGKIVVAGHATDSGIEKYAVARLNTNGTLDTSFNTVGYVLTQIRPRSVVDIAWAVAVQADGKIVASGSTNLDTGATRISLARYNTNGSLDTSFGNNGIVTTSLASGTYTTSYAMQIQSTGRIVVAGASGNSLAVVRYNSGGGLHTGFGDGGAVITQVGSSGEQYALAFQSDDKILAAGFSDSNLVMVRYLKNNTNTITISTPAASSTVTTKPIIFSGQSTQTGATVSLVLDGATTLGTTTTDSFGNWTFSQPLLTNGAHTITANLLDSSSSIIATATNSFTVSVSNAITITAPTSGTTYSTPTTTFAGASTLASATVRIKVDSVIVGTTTTNSLGNWSVTSPALANGNHTLLVELMSGSPLSVVASASVSFTIDSPIIFPPNTSKMRIVAGIVAANGTVQSGTGFTTSTGLGTVTITYTTPFTSTPIFVTSSQALSVLSLSVSSNSGSSTTIALNLGITSFHFIALQFLP